VNEPQPDAKPAFTPTSGVLDEALALVEFLRARCPWDAAQTHRSLRRYLLEEAHEVVDAIDAEDDAALADELGDLLLNLAFQVVVAEERAAFDRASVVNGLTRKMRRRHPHLFGDRPEPAAWDEIKAEERRSGSVSQSGTGLLADLVAGSDPLAHAHRIQAKVATVGFDWPDAYGAWDKVREEVTEVRDELGMDADPRRVESEIGDLLFAVVNLARLAGVHPTTALTRANIKFGRRFARVEEAAARRGIVLETAGLETLDGLWNDVKREER
jgi:MazG family protein